jgi:hypothetical protein
MPVPELVFESVQCPAMRASRLCKDRYGKAEVLFISGCMISWGVLGLTLEMCLRRFKELEEAGLLSATGISPCKGRDPEAVAPVLFGVQCFF